MTSTLIVFARAPVVGAVKSRLAKVIGDEKAAELYFAFLDDTCALTVGVAERRVLAVAGDPAHPQLAALAARDGLAIEPQAQGDLGAKMASAIARHSANGPAVIIGSDSPTLPRSQLERAFVELERHELVLGPAADGGYYLVGARRAEPELFAGVPWGTVAVLAETLGRAGGRACLLLPHYDIDEHEDLLRLWAELSVLPSAVAPATRRVLATLMIS